MTNFNLILNFTLVQAKKFPYTMVSFMEETLKLILLLAFILTSDCFAREFKVMSFNTMCDFCVRDNFDSFAQRKVTIKKVIEEEKADLYSLQEIRTVSQANYFFEKMPEYKLLFWENTWLSHADPVLAINTSRFEILEIGHFWLGPDHQSFNLGWKLALPRRVQWTKLKDLKSEQQFIFIGSHFDNRIENLMGSAHLVQNFIQAQDLPVIFAADTNITSDFKAYPILLGQNMLNTFDVTQDSRSLASTFDGKELCYLRKGKKFPDCRVDHILMSKNSPWTVVNWRINTTKNEADLNYPSDHRPVITTFNY
jgi:endonuclease/exonuclease/phosphatase family metal-dependent hydrolase